MLFDHPETLELEAILHWHSLCTNSLDQELRRVHLALLNGTTLASYLEGILPIGSSLHDTDTYFEACKDELDTALWMPGKTASHRSLPSRIKIGTGIFPV